MFFDKFKRKSPSDSNNYATSTPTQSNATSAKVILTKAEEGLNRSIVRLKKDTGVNLEKHKARVFVVIDRSGSMKTLYNNGSVQKVITRLLPLALKFDDNGELEVYIFNGQCNQMPSVDIHNYEHYVKKQILGKGYFPCGGTCYAPVINKTVLEYNDGSPYPAFGIFITDGENADRQETDSAIRRSSKYEIFYQFIGIGDERFNYLQKLDDLDGREVDNTAFIKVSDFDSMNDDQLYDKLLEQYPQWLNTMHIN